jgi:hypothetical protein
MNASRVASVVAIRASKLNSNEAASSPAPANATGGVNSRSPIAAVSAVASIPAISDGRRCGQIALISGSPASRTARACSQ